jgi:hypothetical protein
VNVGAVTVPVAVVVCECVPKALPVKVSALVTALLPVNVGVLIDPVAVVVCEWVPSAEPVKTSALVTLLLPVKVGADAVAALKVPMPVMNEAEPSENVACTAAAVVCTCHAIACPGAVVPVPALPMPSSNVHDPVAASVPGVPPETFVKPNRNCPFVVGVTVALGAVGVVVEDWN